MKPATQTRRARKFTRELERYGPLFASTTDYVFAKDMDGRYVAANPAYLAALNLESRDLIGLDDHDLYPSREAEELRARDRLVHLSGQPGDHEVPLTIGGRQRRMVVRRFPWQARTGKLLGTITISTDVSAAREGGAREASDGLHLRGSNARLQQMLADQKRLSRRMATLLDAGRELVTTLESDRIHRVAVEVVEQSIPSIAALFLRYVPASNAWTVVAGSPRGEAIASACPEMAAADTPFAEEAQRGRTFRRQRTRSTRFAFDAAAAAAGYTGYVALPVQYGRSHQAVLLAAWPEDGEPLPDDEWLLETLAVQTALALRNAVLYEQLETSMTTLQRAQDQASHARHLQALGQVASGVAHDFNNSLTTILGLSDWLLHELPSDTPYYADLGTIRTAAQDAAAMVRRLQLFGHLRAESRHEAHDRVDLADVARAVSQLARPRCQELSLKSGRAFDVVLEPAAPALVNGSAAELRELLVNLVFNSLDAMPDGGVVRIVTGLDDNRPFVRVVDTGVGMTDEVKARIFEPFFSTKGHKGNGLGLSMCEGIAQRHDALLTVESAPGEGAAFTLVFSESAAQPPHAAATTGVATAPQTPRRVLVVDDQTGVRDSIAAMVSAIGHSVTKADSGAAALARVETSPVDVVVTDLGMPGMNGLELAQRVTASQPHTAVVLITAWGNEFEAAARAAGVQVVRKPVTMAALTHALADAVARHAAGGHGPAEGRSSEVRS